MYIRCNGGFDLNKLVVITGACGVGKSTVYPYLNFDNFRSFEGDAIVNWHDYQGLNDNNNAAYTAMIDYILKHVGEKENGVLCNCVTPHDFIQCKILSNINEVIYIALICSADEIRRRLKARPKERNCYSDEFIEAHIQYNQWFIDNADKYGIELLDNTDATVAETVEKIQFILRRL
jgi:2-phosphoglycerate kinase